MSDWSDENIAKLTELWQAGQSATQIARQLKGGKTRCAVLGKVHRLGLVKHQQLGATRIYHNVIKSREKRKHHWDFSGNPKKKRAPEPVVIAPDQIIPEADRMRLLIRMNGKIYANDKMTADKCRWPIGDPQDEAFHFCGKETAIGLSYCHTHKERAYQTKVIVSRPRAEKIPSFDDMENA